MKRPVNFRYSTSTLMLSLLMMGGVMQPWMTASLMAQENSMDQPAATESAAATQSATQPTTQPAPIVAPPPPTNESVLLSDGKVLLNLRDASLDSVLSFLSKSFGLTVINDVKIEGKVNVYNRQPMTVDETLSVLNTILKDKGYAAVRKGKTLRIIALDAAKKSTIPVHTGNNPAEIADTDEMITQVIPLRMADATQLKKDLASLVPAYADLASNTSTNTLILTDTSANVKKMVEVIRAVDTTVSSVTRIKVFPLKYANATNAARLINDLFKQDTSANQRGAQPFGNFARFFGGAGGAAGGGRFGGPGGPGGMPGATGATADDGSGKPQVKVTAAADDRTNNIVVSAPVDLMSVIEDILKDLDANPAQDQAVFIYPLRNAQAVNVQNVINSLFGTTGSSSTNRTGTTSNSNANNNSNRSSSTSTGFGSSSNSNSSNRTGFGSNSGLSSSNSTNRNTTANNNTANNIAPRVSSSTSQTAADLSGQVYAVADTDTNSVLIMTATTNFERVKTVLAELDRAVPQVLIKVLLAEVTHSDDKDLGAEFSALNLPNVKSSIGTDFGVATATPGGLLYKLSSTDFSVSVAALQKVGKLDVLSRPYILASDNQQASVVVGENVPFITDSRIDSTSGAVNNTVQYQNVGIILNVTPHINPDGLVIMDVAPEISSRTGDTVQISQGVSSPVFATRSAQTRVAIRDGQTIVIGGLMQDKKTQTVHKVPFVGDIPLLGLLFQRDDTVIEKTELLIFMTPHVAKEPGRLQGMSDDEKKGAVITPNAVDKGVFDKHYRDMQRGADTQPGSASTQPDPSSPAPAAP